MRGRERDGGLSGDHERLGMGVIAPGGNELRLGGSARSRRAATAQDPRPNTAEEDEDVEWLMARARQRMSMSPAEVRAERERRGR